ncbi:glycosyltransferase family 2 protein [Flavobacterium sp. P4023]|uniref:Glycosyltransferase family 2 protein n=1 Tax=Flavobacterium flabelliforme TaxID=2816119 RepID=A0ABS5CSB2_9FLAO|nr:glycosyltransferase family A protein [Flavobacterium flabelliforme]MBP4141513.1 glycosyltransferase family 2 protein [Flavobacterium flabelliforme]
MLISVGIPIYNAESYLKLAIDSVLQQTYNDFELLLVNDGSTDKSLEIMKSYNDPRIKIINDGVNKGLIYRLNEMVQLSKGTYFVRMDADDVMFPDRIAKQLELLKSNPKIDIVYSDAVSIDKDNRILGYKESKMVRDKNDVLNGVFPIHPSVMIKKEVLLKNPYKEGFIQMEDMELWYRLVEKYHFQNLNVPLLFYREDSSNNSRKHLKMIQGKTKFSETYKIKKSKIIFSSYLKYVLYFMLEKLKKEHILLNRRFQQLTVIQKENFKKQLDSIISG